MVLPTLYSLSSGGAIEQWRIWIEPLDVGSDFARSDYPYDIITEYGQVGGKLQRAVETVTEGKNLGKKNKTTAKEQAEKQALAEWTAKKARKGYTEDLEKAKAGGNDGAGGVRPMLAKKFTEHGDKLVYPIYAQPKLDGIRCIATVDSAGTVELWSREQKRFLAVPSIALAINLMELPAGTVLDGEFYNHDLHDDFEKISSCVKKQYEASPEDQALIQYHVYDMPSVKGNFFQRWWGLKNSIPADHPKIKIVETRLIDSEDALMDYFNECRENNYEGCMARALQTLDRKGKPVSGDEYEEDSRSVYLQKVKEFDDGEYDIIGVVEGVGKMAGLAVFTCVTKDGDVFQCKLEGSLESLRKYLEDKTTWRGKKLTVQYQGITNKNHVPRFPVGKAVRDYE